MTCKNNRKLPNIGVESVVFRVAEMSGDSFVAVCPIPAHIGVKNKMIEIVVESIVFGVNRPIGGDSPNLT